MTQMSDRLSGKVAIVTGAGNGIGEGCARMFACHGATVIGCDISSKAAELALARAEADGLALEIFAPCDLTDEVAVRDFIDAVAGKHGRIDVLVNAAATAVFNWLEDLSLDDWRRTIIGELDIPFLTTRAAWPHLKASGSASVINFSSVNAYHALEGSPALAHCAGKGGILAMTRQLAMEGAPYGIRANSIAPGLIRTAATAPAFADPAFLQHAVSKSMIKRVGEPEDIAWCATWLASNESSFVTGADISVDGGATAW